MLLEQRASEITSGQLFACTNHPVPTLARLAMWGPEGLQGGPREREGTLAVPADAAENSTRHTHADLALWGTWPDAHPLRPRAAQEGCALTGSHGGAPSGGGIGGWGPENKTRSLVALLQGGALELSSQVPKRLRS